LLLGAKAESRDLLLIQGQCEVEETRMVDSIEDEVAGEGR